MSWEHDQNWDWMDVMVGRRERGAEIYGDTRNETASWHQVQLQVNALKHYTR
jgi:hypothetical protein